MNTNPPVNTLAFAFKKAKVIIKCEECTDYSKNYDFDSNVPQWSNYSNKNYVAVFKLEKKDFLMTSFDITTSNQEAWFLLLDIITTLYSKPFIISLINKGTLGSFYGKLINSKYCACEECDESIFLYFKYNVVSGLYGSTYSNSNCTDCVTNCAYDQCNNTTNCSYGCVPPSNGNFNVSSQANLTYNLEEGFYEGIKFYY